ncbi:MAG: hypothetical protein VX000_14425, partial [Myxococcota bacterium]|nr:hypothetical protein [Myxococcota bacterium]
MPSVPSHSDWRRFLPDRAAAPERDGSVRSRAAIRLATVGLFVAVGYGVLSARAAWLMLLPDERLERKAQVQFESSVRVMGRRGDLLDRDGRILATTVKLQELHADPSGLDDSQIQFLSETLAPQLGLQVEHIAGRLRKPGRKDVRLAKDLTPSEAARLKALAAPLAKVGGKGLFVKELETAMLDGRADLAVHSMKDVPVAFPEGLGLSVICAREDPSDAFVARDDV